MAQTAAQTVVAAGTVVVAAQLEIVAAPVVFGTSELAVGAATQIAEVGMS